jgi:amino acid permease
MGILVAYNDAIRSFLQATPFTTGSDVLDAIITAFLIAPLSVVPDMGYLTKTSAAGLSVLAFALLVITGYGLNNYSSDTAFALQWFPRHGLTGVSSWFGCTVFGFGVVPLTFNFRDSMAEPSKFNHANLSALMLVAAVYITVGISLLILYPDIESEVLSEIPQEGILPIVTRLAMVVVVIATAPLLIVPCGELIEGKLNRGEVDQRTKVVVRFGICFLTVAISVGVPGFVSVLTFVGCFCVAFVSFCIPPALHLVLLIRHKAPPKALLLDALMLSWGLAATGISTAYVFRKAASPTASWQG